MDSVHKLDQIGLVFTMEHSGTVLVRIQNWACFFAGPVLDPFGTIPDQFQILLCKQKPIRSSLVRSSSGPVPCITEPFSSMHHHHKIIIPRYSLALINYSYTTNNPLQTASVLISMSMPAAVFRVRQVL